MGKKDGPSTVRPWWQRLDGHPRPNRTFDPAKERHRDVAILTGLVALVVIALGVGLIVGSTEVRWAANSFAAVTLLLTLVLAWSYRRG